MRVVAGLTAIGLALACSTGFEPVPDGKQYSIIDAGGAMPQDFLAPPNTVKAGPVAIKYNSYGSSSCNVPAGEAVALAAGTVTITAYDRYLPPETACTADFGRFSRSVTITLAAGIVELRLRGMLSVGGSQVGMLKRTVVVQ